jgi:hypothetical protein
VAIEVEHLLTEVGYDTKLQYGQVPSEDEHADELPWDGFWQLVLKLFSCGLLSGAVV